MLTKDIFLMSSLKLIKFFRLRIVFINFRLVYLTFYFVSSYHNSKVVLYFNAFKGSNMDKKNQILKFIVIKYIYFNLI